MAITSIKTGSSFTNLQKYNDFLGPNAAYIPSSFESIATINVGTAVSSITFSSIPSTYTSLQIRFMASAAYGSYNNTTIRCELNGDTTSSNYYFHALYGEGSSAIAQATQLQKITQGLDSPTTTSIYGVGIIDLHNYAITTQNKTLRAFAGFDTNGEVSANRVYLSSMLWMNTSAINSIKLIGQDGNWTVGSTFALYGIKGA
jgi:hypothetical protein